jgi:hypothetical protein
MFQCRVSGKVDPSIPDLSHTILVLLTIQKACSNCRKRRVKCDRLKPTCQKCQLQDQCCIWEDDLRAPPLKSRQLEDSAILALSSVSRATISYLHHLVTDCCGLLTYSHDGGRNPFEEELVPLAAQSPALLHAMAAVGAGHLLRGQEQHQMSAASHYSFALQGLTHTLDDTTAAGSDATLGPCLLLCVYEVGGASFGQCMSLTKLRCRIQAVAYGCRKWSPISLT